MPTGFLIAAAFAALGTIAGGALVFSGVIAAVVPTCGPAALRRPLAASAAACAGIALFVWSLDHAAALLAAR